MSSANSETFERCVKSILELIVLKSLQDEAMCGYDIIATVHKKYYTLLSPGTIYPMLASLEKDGLLERTEDQKRRVYKITQKGGETVSALFGIYLKILAMSRPQETEDVDVEGLT
ncbi:MAG: PadR family transcriptional regulator [Candidatus Bathyarchaeota archaeon]